MKRLIQFATITALATGMMFAQAPSPAPSPNAHPGRHAFMRRHMTRIGQALQLTDAQKEQAKAIFQQARTTSQPIRAQLKQNREALAAAVKAGKSDADLQQLSAQQGTLLGQMAAVRAEALAKFYQTLTPEQRAKAGQMHQQRRGRFGNRG